MPSQASENREAATVDGTDQGEAPATCGQGLAASAPLPRTIGELMAAMGRMLAAHQQALDLTDDAARKEHEAYLQLATELGAAASQLSAVGAQMIAYRGLPMGRHDEEAMAGPESRQSFEDFVRLERALRDLLDARLREDEEMLRQWG
jgi:hypothetical protein